MNERLRARASTACGKIAGKLLERRTSARVFRASFSSCHRDTAPLPQRGHYFIELVKFLSLLETLGSYTSPEAKGHSRKKANVNVSVVSKTLRGMVPPSEKILSALDL